MIHFPYPAWTMTLMNLYWHLRDKRTFDSAAQRKYYRRIEVEKKRLHGSGINKELIRLYCLHLADPSREARALRVIQFETQMREQRFNLARPVFLQVGLANEAARTRVA